MITAVASVCYVATWEVIYHRFAPDYIDKYAAYTVDKMKKSGASDAQILAKTKEMAEFSETYKNPLVNIAYTFLEPLPIRLGMAGKVFPGILFHFPHRRASCRIWRTALRLARTQ